MIRWAAAGLARVNAGWLWDQIFRGGYSAAATFYLATCLSSKI